ncbi:MAG: phosphoribosylformylglycinamidine synthase subunit PurQ [Candidatus Anstonellaceae archaeon]
MANPAPKCLVLAGFGLNSEAELAHAFSMAGAESAIVHFSKIANGEKKLEDYQIFAIPGGWSYADEISSGKVLANKLKSSFHRQLEEFIASGKAVVGICNGFQVLVKLGALPNLSGNFEQECTLTRNSSGKFEDRWVYLKPQPSVCKYFEGVSFIHCPVRHGEGRFIASESVLEELEKRKLIVAKYATADLEEASSYPENPNGAQKNIAGICNPAGNVIGLMPHPECSVAKFLFPRWTAGVSFEKNSLLFFSNIVKAAQKFV